MEILKKGVQAILQAKPVAHVTPEASQGHLLLSSTNICPGNFFLKLKFFDFAEQFVFEFYT